MALSRSRLFALALRDYLRRRHQQQLVEQLNRVFAGKADLSDKRITTRMKNKFRATMRVVVGGVLAMMVTFGLAVFLASDMDEPPKCRVSL